MEMVCKLPSISFTNICLISSNKFNNLCGLSFIQKQAQAKTEEKVIIAKKLSFPNSVTILAGTILIKIPVLRLSEIEISVKEDAPVVANLLFTSVKRNFVVRADLEHEREPSVD
jgi:soluble P-type ATPase